MKISKIKKTCLALGLSFASLTSFSQGPVPVTANLIGSWEFTGGSLLDGTGSNHGTLVGPALTQVTDRCGNQNAALQFNGSNYIDLNATGPLGNVARSVSFWMKTDALSNKSPKAMFSYGVYVSGGHAAYEINWDYGCKGLGPDDGDRQITFTQANLDDKCWHHVVAVQDVNYATNQILIYFDGSLLTTVCQTSGNNPPAVLNTQSFKIRFGATTGPSPGRRFVGSLDDFYLYDRALSPAEVGQLYGQCNLVACSSSTVTEPPVDGCCLGNSCDDQSNPLASNYEIPLNGKHFNFSGDQELADKVNVGYPCSSFGIGKLNSFTERYTSSRLPGFESVSIFGHNRFVSDNETGIGVMGEAENNSSGYSKGVFGRGIGDGNNIGGDFYAGRSQSQFPNVTNIGVNAIAFPSTGNPAPYTYLSPYPDANIGIYAAGEINNSSEGAPGQDWAAWFDGDVMVNGVGYIPGGFWINSDKRFKKDILKIENVVDKLKKLNGYTYNFKTEEFKQKGFSKTQQIGVLAQELKEIFPQLVKEDASGYLSVNYEGLIPVLIEGFKSQQQQIENLEKKLAEQNQKENATTGINTLNSVETGYQMSQNEPNPFTHETVVKYTLPTTVSLAQMVVYDLTGKQITIFPISEKGESSVVITSEKLSAGIYIYSIVADGKVVDSKKMIVADK